MHYLVPAGGVAPARHTWLSATSAKFLLPVKALSRIFRAKFRDALRHTPAFTEVPSTVWQQEWVVHCQPVGNGLNALKYLAPYIFRVAISNRRILKVEHDRVTFRYRASDTGTLRTCTLPAEEFIRRFLQHVLPRSFVKVRYYGFFSPGLRQRLATIRRQLDTAAPTPDACYPASSAKAADAPPSLTPPQSFVRCPACGQTMRPRPLAHPERGQPP